MRMHHCLYVINYQIFQTTGRRVQSRIPAASSYDLFYSYCVTHSWMGCSHGAVMHSLTVLWKLLHVSSDTSRSVSLMWWDCTRIPRYSLLCNLCDTNQQSRVACCGGAETVFQSEDHLESLSSKQNYVFLTQYIIYKRIVQKIFSVRFIVKKALQQINIKSFWMQIHWILSKIMHFYKI